MDCLENEYCNKELNKFYSGICIYTGCHGEKPNITTNSSKVTFGEKPMLNG